MTSIRPRVARVDALVAANVGRWPSLTTRRLSVQVDKIVAQVDADAVRRAKQRHSGREISIWDDEDGISHVQGTLASPDAHALDRKLNALAATVCPHDPRTAVQRRADAMGALAADADRLGCRCGRPDCAAGTRPPARPVVIHVIAEQATLDGASTTPACEVSADGLITPELIQELALSAKRVPLIHPGYAPPEPQPPAVEGVGRFRAVPGSDVSVAGLRCARGALRRRSHDPVCAGWAHPCGEFEVLLPYPSFV